MGKDPIADRWKEERLAEIDRRWEERKGQGIDWYVLDVADLRRWVREAEEENCKLRQLLDAVLDLLDAKWRGDDTADEWGALYGAVRALGYAWNERYQTWRIRNHDDD